MAKPGLAESEMNRIRAITIGTAATLGSSLLYLSLLFLVLVAGSNTTYAYIAYGGGGGSGGGTQSCAGLKIATSTGLQNSGLCNTDAQSTYYVYVDSGGAGAMSVSVTRAAGGSPVVYSQASTAACNNHLQGSFIMGQDQLLLVTVNGGKGGGACSGGVYAYLSPVKLTTSTTVKTTTTKPTTTTIVPTIYFGNPAISVSTNPIIVGQTATIMVNVQGADAQSATYKWHLGLVTGNGLGPIGTNSSTLIFHGNSTTEQYSPESVSVTVTAGGTSISTAVSMKVNP